MNDTVYRFFFTAGKIKLALHLYHSSHSVHFFKNLISTKDEQNYFKNFF